MIEAMVSDAVYDSQQQPDRRYHHANGSPTPSSKNNDTASLTSTIIHENGGSSCNGDSSDKNIAPAQVSIRYDCENSASDENSRSRTLRSRGSLKHLYKRSSESALHRKAIVSDSDPSRNSSQPSLNRIARETDARKSSEIAARIYTSRRCSLDSSEVIRMSRDRLFHVGSGFPPTEESGRTLIEEYTSAEIHHDKPSGGKLSGIFRRRSNSSKSLAGRKPSHINNGCMEESLKRRASFGAAVKRSASFSNDREVVRERDRALEEWGRAATKCEELIEELECTLSELIMIKTERDEKEQEVEQLMQFYEHNMDERDKLISELNGRVNQAEDKVEVARRERTEAYEQRDELLQHSYKCSQEVETLKDGEEKQKEQIRLLTDQIKSYENQVNTLKSERDHAVKLWKETMEERKRVYDEQIVLAQAKDDALQKTFVQIEEINVLRTERDELLRRIEHSQFISGVGEEEYECAQRKTDSGFLSGTRIKAEDTVSDSALTSVPSLRGHFEHRHSHVVFDTEEYEDIAICMDTFDSRVGWKLDNAFDEPRVLVSLVTPQAEQKWNIKKHDRILSVNSTNVQRANKKTVERLIRDTTGRTISLVLRREKEHSGTKLHADVDVCLPKQQTELGLQCKLQIKRINSDTQLNGSEQLKEGDVITKINSQDTSEIVSSMLLKLIRKWSGRTTLRVRREGGFHDNGNNNNNNTATKRLTNQSLLSIHRKSSAGSSNNSTPKSSIFTDISSLLSYTSSDNRNYSHEILDIVVKNFTSLSTTPYDSSDNIPTKLSTSALEECSKTDKAANRLSVTTIHNSLENINVSSHAAVMHGIARRSTRRPRLRLPSLGASLGKSFSKSLSKDAGGGSGVVGEGFGGDGDIESPCLYKLLRYATLPRNYQRNPYTRQSRSASITTTSRIINICKEETDPVGFGMCGGNRIGIFVKDLSASSVTAGLKIGDRVLSINSTELSKASLDFAMRVLLLHRSYTQLRIEVRNYPNYDELMKDEPYESLYVRCLKSHVSSNESELSFDVGTMIHVTNTVVNYDDVTMTWSWKGEKNRNKETMASGIIPWIQPFEDDSPSQSGELQETSEDTPVTNTNNLDSHDKRKRRTLVKTAQELRRWLSWKPTWGRRKNTRKGQGREIC